MNQKYVHLLDLRSVVSFYFTLNGNIDLPKPRQQYQENI
jgi:hypothetical protein